MQCRRQRGRERRDIRSRRRQRRRLERRRDRRHGRRRDRWPRRRRLRRRLRRYGRVRLAVLVEGPSGGSIFDNFSAHADGERRGLGRIGGQSDRSRWGAQIGHGSSAFAVGTLRDIEKITALSHRLSRARAAAAEHVQTVVPHRRLYSYRL